MTQADRPGPPARGLRIISFSAGVLAIAGAIAADRFGSGGSAGFGPGQAMLTALGVVLIVAGLLGSRLPAAYKGLALILLNTAILVLLLEAMSMVALRLVSAPRSNDARARYRSDIEAISWYADRPWVEDFWREHWAVERAQRYTPYVLWHIAPHTGTWVNVDESGLRHTPGSECGDGVMRIAVFGGSAVWGWGAPDDGTIPAHLQRELTEQRQPVCVINYGQNGWVSSQEVIELQRLLATGEIPDVAIFYHGYNDIGAAAQTGRAGLHLYHERIARRFESEESSPPSNGVRGLLERTRMWALIQQLTRRDAGTVSPVRTMPSDAAVAALADSVVQVWLANDRVLRALAREYGFALHVFWQPLLPLSGKPKTAEEEQLGRGLGNILPLAQAVFDGIAEAGPKDGHFHDLRGIFDQDSTLAFIDFVHLTPDANRAVALRILRELPLDRVGGMQPNRE